MTRALRWARRLTAAWAAGTVAGIVLHGLNLWWIGHRPDVRGTR